MKTKMRQEAEDLFLKNSDYGPEKLESLSPIKTREMLHELHIQQIELKMQNEELIRTHVRLEGAQARYFALFDLAPTGYITLDGQGQIQEANLHAATLLGISRAELIGQPFNRFILGEDQDKHYFHNKQLATESAPQDYQLRMTRAGNAPFWAHLQASVIKNIPDMPAYLLALSDITGQKHVEQTLRESEASFRALAENNLDVIMRFDSELRHLYTNPQSELQSGIPSEALLGKTCREMGFPPELVDLWEGALERTFATGTKQRLEFQLPTGMWIDWLCMPELDEKGHVRAVMTSARDISELKRVAAELRETNESLSNFMEHAILGMYRTSIEGRPLLTNPAFCAMSGYASSEEIVREYEQKPETELEINPVYSRARFQKEIREKGSVIGFESPWMKPDGEVVMLRECAWTVLDSEGKPKAYEGIFEDITEQKKNEDQIRKLLAEKELILHEVHHRIKNNMATMTSLLSLQSQRTKLPEAAAVFKDAQGRLKSMAILYDKLYRQDNVREMPVKRYLPSLIADIVNLYPDSAMVKTEVRIDDFVLGAKLLAPLGILVNEVVSNSMKHAFIGRESGVISVSATEKNGTVCLTMQDDGIGLPESVDSATAGGLGMQLITMLAAQMNGTLRVVRGVGTTYELEFTL